MNGSGGGVRVWGLLMEDGLVDRLVRKNLSSHCSDSGSALKSIHVRIPSLWCQSIKSIQFHSLMNDLKESRILMIVPYYSAFNCK